MPNAAVYARVSTEEQSVATQLDLLILAAGQRGLTIPAGQLYADDGVTGRADSRPEFDRLRDAITARTVDAVLVTKLDRLARSVPTALAFFDLCESANVRIIVTDQAIDTATPAGRLTRTILAAVAEFEGDLIRERTQVAMDALRSGARKTRSGRPVGRPRRVTEAVAGRVAALRATGLPWKDVARRVGLPAETCRRASWLLARGKMAVQNSPPSTKLPQPGEEPSR